jgi:hypothetical protein
VPDGRAWLVAGAMLLVLAALLVWRRRIRPAWMFAGAVALGVTSAVFLHREPLVDLTPELLESARARWAQAATSDYDLGVLVHADRLDDGRFDVQVRGGVVTAMRRNGLATTGTADAYSIPGIFDILERELELSHNPSGGFGAPAGYRAYLKVRFHPSLGYPEKYRRIVGGTSNSVEITVEHFQPAS